MYPFALANESPVPAFLWSAMQEPRIPCQRHRNNAPIRELGDQSIVGNANILYRNWLYLSP